MAYTTYNGNVFYATRPNITSSWTYATLISHAYGGFSDNDRYVAICMDSIGYKLVVSTLVGVITCYLWNSSTSSYTLSGTIPTPITFIAVSGCKMNQSGTVLVVCENNTSIGYTYCSTWNTATQNFNTLIQTLDTVKRGNKASGPAISGNGRLIAYGGNPGAGGYDYGYAIWDGTNYGVFNKINTLSSINVYGGCFNSDGSVLFIDAYPNPLYGIFNNVSQTFDSFIPISNISMASDDMAAWPMTNIFTISHDGKTLLWNSNYSRSDIRSLSLIYNLYGGSLGGNTGATGAASIFSTTISSGNLVIQTGTSTRYSIGIKYPYKFSNVFNQYTSFSNSGTPVNSALTFPSFTFSTTNSIMDMAISLDNTKIVFGCLNNTSNIATLYYSTYSSTGWSTPLSFYTYSNVNGYLSMCMDAIGTVIMATVPTIGQTTNNGIQLFTWKRNDIPTYLDSILGPFGVYNSTFSVRMTPDSNMVVCSVGKITSNYPTAIYWFYFNCNIWTGYYISAFNKIYNVTDGTYTTVNCPIINGLGTQIYFTCNNLYSYDNIINIPSETTNQLCISNFVSGTFAAPNIYNIGSIESNYYNGCACNVDGSFICLAPTNGTSTGSKTVYFVNLQNNPTISSNSSTQLTTFPKSTTVPSTPYTNMNHTTLVISYDGLTMYNSSGNGLYYTTLSYITPSFTVSLL
jgi:hypothetical protein